MATSTLRGDSANNGLVTAIEAIYASALDALHWPMALAAAADCMGDFGAILLWRCDDGSYSSIASKSLLGVQNEWERQGWSVMDSHALYPGDTSRFFSGVPFTGKYIFSDEGAHTRSLYTHFQTQHALGVFGAVGVSPDPHVGVILSLFCKAERRSDYSDDELATISRLGAHVQKSLKLSVRLLNSELQKVSLGDSLSRAGIGVFILDSCGHVLFVNQVGQDLLGDGLAMTDDRLLIGSGPARKALECAIKQAIRHSLENGVPEPKPVATRCLKTDRPLAIYALPLAPSAHPVAQFGPRGRVLVLALGLKEIGTPDPDLIRDLLGLTLGEARLAARVGSGVALHEAAKMLGITEETARTVLKHIFSKTGVSRQGQLVSLLSRMVLH